MYNKAAIAAVGLASLLLVGPSALQAQGFSYKPPNRGTTSSDMRVGGGTRGVNDQPLTVSVLAPAHEGLTIKEQPKLYWYVSREVNAPMEITLLAEDQDDPVLWLKLSQTQAAGIHALDLSRHGIKLKQDVPYQWFVAVVTDPKHRSNDIVAAAELRRVAADKGVLSKAAGVDHSMAAAVYAEAGLWYDALESLGNSIDGDREKGSRAARASLLEQVGLTQIADWDKARM